MARTGTLSEGIAAPKHAEEQGNTLLYTYTFVALLRS